MRTTSLRLVAVVAILAGCAKEAKPPAASPARVAGAPAPKGAAIQPDVGVAAKLRTLRPSRTARKGGGMRKGPVPLNPALLPRDDDPVSVEQIAPSGGGSLTVAQVVRDSLTRTVYAYSAASVMCKDGSTIAGAELMTVYGDSNTFQQPPGSGWYAVELRKGQCEADAPTVWGVRFDTTGRVLAEGPASLDAKTRELVMLAPAAPPPPAVATP